MRSQMSFTKSIALGAFALVPGLLMGGSAVAQDAAPGSTPAGPSAGYPVAIHAGSCDDLTAQPKYEIANAVAFGTDDSDGDVKTIGNSDPDPMILNASAAIDSSLDDLGNNGNAIAVHKSPDDYDTIVACGNVAGVNNDGKVVIALNSTQDSTVVGVAILDSDNSGILGLGDDQVKATVYIFDTADAGSSTPEA